MSQKPTILMILTEFPPRIGGMQTHAVHLARGLWEKGYPIQIVTYRDLTPQDAASSRETDQKLPFPVHRVLSRIGYFHNLDILARMCCQSKPDLVYASTVFYGALAQRVGLPVVARSAGNDVLRPWIVYPFRRLRSLVSSRWFERNLYDWFRRLESPEFLDHILRTRRRDLMIHAAQQLSAVLPNSQFTAEKLERIGVEKSRIRATPGGVDARRFEQVEPSENWRAKLDIPKERFVLMTACRLERRKAVDFLIRSLPQVAELIPEVHLLIVGDGRDRRRLEKLKRDSTCRDRVTFAGAVSHESIAPLYLAANVFVLASRLRVNPRTGLMDAETMGRVLCEANAAGVPVIAARSGGIPSVVADGDNGLLFEPDEMDGFRSALQRLYQNQSDRERMIARGRERARDEFDWSIICKAHEEVFAAALRDPK